MNIFIIFPRYFLRSISGSLPMIPASIDHGSIRSTSVSLSVQALSVMDV